MPPSDGGGPARPSAARIAMPLEIYRRKRDFKRSPEPRGSFRRRTKQLIFDHRKGYAQGKVAFTLEGRKLSGGWALIRMRGPAEDGHRDNWLLIKERNDVTMPAARDGRRRPRR